MFDNLFSCFFCATRSGGSAFQFGEWLSGFEIAANQPFTPPMHRMHSIPTAEMKRKRCTLGTKSLKEKGTRNSFSLSAIAIEVLLQCCEKLFFSAVMQFSVSLFSFGATSISISVSSAISHHISEERWRLSTNVPRISKLFWTFGYREARQTYEKVEALIWQCNMLTSLKCDTSLAWNVGWKSTWPQSNATRF